MRDRNLVIIKDIDQRTEIRAQKCGANDSLHKLKMKYFSDMAEVP